MCLERTGTASERKRAEKESEEMKGHGIRMKEKQRTLSSAEIEFIPQTDGRLRAVQPLQNSPTPGPRSSGR
jgi:hypothetical protein